MENKYIVVVPIVGYVSVNVEAVSEKEAKEKALDICCDFDHSDVDVQELYGVENVADGNVVNHPYWNLTVEEE